MVSVSDWKRLGLTLGLLYHPTLTEIETHRHYQVEDCKKDMLLSWLQQKDDVLQTGVPFMDCVESCTAEDWRE